MTSDYPDPEPIEDIPEPYEDLLPNVPQRTVAVQNWNVTVSDAKFHWYDLVAGFPAVPDIRDPVGRYLRRMQFDLEATMEKRLLYLVVSRPLVRFDTNRSPSWGFFSLKLTVPLLLGAEQKRDSVTLELEVPFAATMKKPVVTVQDRFLILNWGGLVEAMSIHDVLQHHDHGLKYVSRVHYVGQTKDTSGRLAKGRLTALQKIQQNNSEHSDTLLLVQRLNFEIDSAQGDPALLPANQNAVAADSLLKDRMDLVECAVIKYFEGDVMRGRKDHELAVRRARMVEVQAAHNVNDVNIDLTSPDSDGDRYYDLMSDYVPVSRGHRMHCHLINGDIALTILPPERKA